MATTQYIGARYVPIFGRLGEDSIQWDNTATYEPLTVVLYQGNSYTSRQFVPVGIEITNQDYWAETGNYNAQIEQYRQDVQGMQQGIDDNVAAINTEADRAKAAEEANTAAINAEASRAKAAEEANTAAINAEASRAENSEKNIPTKLNVLENSLSSKKYYMKGMLGSARKLYGNYDNAVCASFIANATSDQPHAQVTGASTSYLASKIIYRDTVALYASNVLRDTGGTIEIDKANVVYSENGFSIKNVDFSILENVLPGMFVDCFNGSTPEANSTWCMSKIVSVDKESGSVVVEGWYQQRTDGNVVEMVPSDVNCHVNYQTGAWAANFNVSSSSGIGYGLEIGVQNNKETNEKDELFGVFVKTLSDTNGYCSSAFKGDGKFLNMFDAKNMTNRSNKAFVTNNWAINGNGVQEGFSVKYTLASQDREIDSSIVFVGINASSKSEITTSYNPNIGQIVFLWNATGMDHTFNTKTVKANNLAIAFYDGSSWRVFNISN